MKAVEYPDFTQQQEPLSINGFPLTFRAVRFPGGHRLWVPRGISRNEEFKCWRIYLVHEAGLMALNVADGRNPPVHSLVEAYDILTGELTGVQSRFVVDQRARSPGVERDPLIDTGVTGVKVSRISREGKKVVTVSTQVTVKKPDGSLHFTNWYAGGITERAVETDPMAQERELFRMLRRAIDVRRYFRRLRSEAQYPAAMIRYDDVPEDIRQQPVELPNLDLVAIMDSFMVSPWQPTIRTTGGDPEALAATLKNSDLEEPQKKCWLNGHQIRFSKTVIEGRTLFLTKTLFRTRGKWRIRIYHVEGIFEDAVTDAECHSDMMQSLQRAWRHLVDRLISLEACPSRKKVVRMPLLDTTLPGVAVTPLSRIGKKSPKPRWTFSLSYRQKTGDTEERKTTIRTWLLSTITDEQIAHDMAHAAAMVTYREHLLDAGETFENAFVTKATHIPDRFWPHNPVCPFSADDLRYHAQQKDAADLT